MNESEQVSQLIGDIYDAALEPSTWPPVLEMTCDFIVGVASALISYDLLHKGPSAKFHFSWGDDPDYTQSYLTKYVKLNPTLVPTTVSTKVGEVSTFLDFISLEEYQATQFYKEWSGPQGYLDGVQAVLDKSATSYASVAVVRHESQGIMDDEARRRMRLLAPHFHRAVAIGKLVELRKVEAVALADTLDGLVHAMYLVDGKGRVVHANLRGLTMLAEGSAVRSAAGGKLTIVDLDAEQTLSGVFKNACNGDLAVGADGIAIPIESREDKNYVAHVLPLTSGRRRKAGIAYAAVAAVFLREAVLNLPHPLEALANAHNLTPAEMRVLMMIVEVGGVPEVASVLGVSEPTVKTHLQHIFDKTGIRRQVDLVKLVVGYMGPLR